MLLCSALENKHRGEKQLSEESPLTELLCQHCQQHKQLCYYYQDDWQHNFKTTTTISLL